MAKKKALKSNKIQKVHESDRIPKWRKQPRSAGGYRRRRTDFSPFFCSSCSSSSSSSTSSYALSSSPLGLLVESSRGKDKPGCDSITDLEEMRARREKILHFPVVQCSNFDDLRKNLISNFTEVPAIQVESINQNALFDGRNADKQKSGNVGTLEFTLDTSQINERSNFCITSGCATWDKTARQLWPGEALEYQSFSKEFTESSDDPNCSITRDQSLDKWNSSSSSRTESDCMERRRGTRERKPKVHFDEVNFYLKSMRKDRRFRIMRFLGLAAPVASP